MNIFFISCFSFLQGFQNLVGISMRTNYTYKVLKTLQEDELLF